MYETFFGFTERPFQLVPNPAYLFLSKSHEEALAHLSYAASQGDGFVEITGEVGTGKTTLCRAFLDNLGSETEVAYIFNPTQTPAQLLKSVNDELNIPSQAESCKELIIALNRFLLQKKAEGKAVILLIDEAQNLSQETLEQLRLLSNLETSTSKLIQIILVGQPELGALLDSPAMRQLNQRITLSCRLTPLTFSETREYIQHRLWIASRKARPIFTPWACFAVHRFSRGLPRLINIACDRALLTAFGVGRTRVTWPLVRRATRELDSRKHLCQRFRLLRTSPGILAILTAGLFLLYLFPLSFFSQQHTISENLKPTSLVNQGPDDRKADSPTSADGRNPSRLQVKPENSDLDRQKQKSGVADAPFEQTPRKSLTAYLKETDPLKSRETALQAVLSRWQSNGLISSKSSLHPETEAFFRASARKNGLATLAVQGDLPLLMRLNLPVILKCFPPGSTLPLFVALTQVKEKSLILKTDEPNLNIETTERQLDTYWRGGAYVLWKNFFQLNGLIPGGHSDASLITLKNLLQEIGFQNLGDSPDYNERTRQAVQQVQARNGLQVDGLVGPRTKIALYNELEQLQIPHLVHMAPNNEVMP